MKSFEDQVKEKRDGAMSAKELFEAYDWLTVRAFEYAALASEYEEAIVSLYGQEGLEAIEDEIERMRPVEKTEAEKLAEFGFTDDTIVSMSRKEAEAFFGWGYEVFLLNPDNTKTLAKSREDILSHPYDWFGMDEKVMEQHVSSMMDAMFKGSER